MATKAYIIPVRNDIPAGQLQIDDVTPNTSQKSAIYEGAGQSGYVQSGRVLSTDFPGDTANQAVNAADHEEIQADESGLAAYLRVKVHADPTGANRNMSPGEAYRTAQLVIQAGALTKGNDQFVLDMGKQIKIADLLYIIIKLSGLTEKNNKNPDGEI